MLRGMLVLLCAELMMAFPGAAEETAPPTALPAWPTPAVELHVAPGGDDGAAGTADAPLATLEAARDRLRALRTEGRLDEGGARVLVHGGRYAVTQTFTLTEQDTGTADAPVRYEAAPGETPVFSGGVRLEGFQPVTDEAVLARLPEAARGQVLQVDVKRFGVTDLAPPRLGGFSSGLGFKTHPVKELFFNGEAMPMSRWPNEGFARIAATVVDDGHTIHGRKGSKVGQLVYEGDRPARWVDEAAPLLYGY